MLFPSIQNIKQILPAIEKRPEFSVVDKGVYTYIDYRYIENNTFENPLEEGITPQEKLYRQYRLECRGIKFDSKTGNIVCRMFHKFFNSGEKPWQYPPQENVAYTLTEKLDGSLIGAFWIDNDVVFGSKAGNDTDVAAHATSFVDSQTDIDYRGFCDICITAGFTPLFEWCSPQDRIVVEQPEPKLVLIGIRHMLFGHYISYDDMKLYASSFNVPVVRVETYNPNTLSQIARQEGFEGFVLRDENSGYMEKIKTDWYCLRHKARSGLVWEKDVVAMVLESKFDDVRQFFSVSENAEIDRYSQELLVKYKFYSKKLLEDYKELYERFGSDRKSFAQHVTKHNSRGMQSWLFRLYGQDPNSEDTKILAERFTMEYFIKNTKTKTLVELSREMGLLPEKPWQPLMFSGNN